MRSAHVGDLARALHLARLLLRAFYVTTCAGEVIKDYDLFSFDDAEVS
jgi:hypothetical protein